MMAVKSGRAIRFPEEKVRATGRGAIGVGGIEVDNAKDEVIGMICVQRNETAKTVLVVSEKGFGKRTRVDEYRITNRGGKGVKTINVTEKTGSLVGILDVEESEDLLITCKSGIILRTSVKNIKEAGRATQGVKLIRLDEGDEIAAITKLNEQEEEPEINDAADDDIIITEAGSDIMENDNNEEGENKEGSDNNSENDKDENATV
jgi:DNA gyrase subunit A